MSQVAASGATADVSVGVEAGAVATAGDAGAANGAPRRDVAAFVRAGQRQGVEARLVVTDGHRERPDRFEGTDGWIFVSRGNETVTASDPVTKLKDPQALAASDPKIITSVIGPDEIHLYDSKEHHGNWLDCIRSRQQPIAPVEVAHRACSACLLHHMAMKLKRKLYWDPNRERFKNDDEANGLLSRPQRTPYTLP